MIMITIQLMVPPNTREDVNGNQAVASNSITLCQEPTGLWSHLPKAAIPLDWAPSTRAGVSRD